MLRRLYWRVRARAGRLKRGVYAMLWRRAQNLGDPSAIQYVPPGHFYSPIPALDDVRARDETIFASPPSLEGIDLRADEQLELVRQLSRFHKDQPFSATPGEKTRYHFENNFFNYGDGLMLHCMLRHVRPHRIVEVGSGYSTALIQDTIQLFDLDTRHTAIDPFPHVAQKLIASSGPALHIEPHPVQTVAPEHFNALKAGDILFIDSTHVSKVGSDVNVLYFDVLPHLVPGVIVHIHDVFYPFEYPRSWVYEGRAWNEDYLLRAFLMYNDRFRILLFNNWLAQFHLQEVSELFPLWQKNTGCSLWLERV